MILFITSAHLTESDMISSSSTNMILLFGGVLSEKKGDLIPNCFIITNKFGIQVFIETFFCLS